MYYLYTIKTAKRLGCAVQMYGCGIGPVTGSGARLRVSQILNTCVDAVTLREKHSREELESCGVTVPELIDAADPALTLGAADSAQVDAFLTEMNMDKNGAYVCFCVRPWKGFSAKAQAFAEAARHVWETYGLTPVLLPINHRTDTEAAKQVASYLGDCPSVILDGKLDGALTSGVMSRMRAAVSMRLHGLIFAAGQRIPTVGVSYDPKVSAFMDTLGEGWVSLAALTGEHLIALLDHALGEDAAELGRRTDAILALEHRNAETARRLMKL